MHAGVLRAAASPHVALLSTTVLCFAVGTAGCTPDQVGVGVAAGVIGTTVVGARSPANDVQQVYYVGVFDPLEQLPPQMYRVRIHGQASAISAVEFASGWVPAQIADSLNAQLIVDPETKRVKFDTGEGEPLAELEVGRRMIHFGPDGFRMAPKDHRLAVVMGSDPSAFFQAVNEVLGTVAMAQEAQRGGEVAADVLREQNRITGEQLAVSETKADWTVAFAQQGGE